MKRFMLLISLIFPLCAWGQSAPRSEFSYPETYMQYTPIVFDLGAEYLGVAPKHSLAERAVAMAIGTAANTAICYTLKALVSEERPDHSRFNSFPSGHTAQAFVGAELIRQDYGNAWGAAFYACGVGVAAGRVVHKRHWWWDTLAGAGIGVFSAWIGRWVTDCLDLPGLDSKLVDGLSYDLILVPAREGKTEELQLCLRVAF